MDKAKAYIGKRKNLTHDRFYIVNILKELKDKSSLRSMLIKRVIVFGPVGILAEGGELIDLQGFGDTDLLRKSE